MRRRPFLLLVSLWALAALGCGVIGAVPDPAPLSGPVYWAAATGAPLPTTTVWLGTTTPVVATVAATMTPTGPLTVTTTPGLPIIGFSAPAALATPLYRVGTFYMHSDVYIGGPDGVALRLTDHIEQPSPRQTDAVFHFLTVQVTNYGAEPVTVPLPDLFFIRRVWVGAEPLMGRWTPQNEPLAARGLPSYAAQVASIPPGETHTYTIGFVVPAGEVRAVGLITDWNQPVEGGAPIWFQLTPDPLGPFVDADRPPPPTPVVLDSGGVGGGPPPGSGGPGGQAGGWPTTGLVTRGFGCSDLYTGIDGAGFGCPADRPWFHNGVDVANAAGTLVWAPVDGVLVYAGPDSAGADCSALPGSLPPHAGLGNYQRLSGAGTVHYFGHLRDFLMTSGAVTAGQTLAEMGSTGCSTGTHLHWMVYEHGHLVDPALWAGPGPTP